MSLSDLTRLAGVQRPVPPMWRTRFRDTDHPFPEPEPVHGDRDALLFKDDEVVAWLEATDRGNNPAVRLEQALHDERPSRLLAALDAASSLLLLRHLSDEPLAEHTGSTVLAPRAADAHRTAAPATAVDAAIALSGAAADLRHHAFGAGGIVSMRDARRLVELAPAAAPEPREQRHLTWARLIRAFGRDTSGIGIPSEELADTGAAQWPRSAPRGCAARFPGRGAVSIGSVWRTSPVNAYRTRTCGGSASARQTGAWIWAESIAR